jgi:hypothetical protein
MVIESIFSSKTGTKTKRFYLFRPDSAEKRGKEGAAVKFEKEEKMFFAEKMISITIQW